MRRKVDFMTVQEIGGGDHADMASFENVFFLDLPRLTHKEKNSKISDFEQHQ